MIKPISFLLLLLCAVSITTLSGCSSAKKQLGMTRQSPDEFAVVERAPLSLPPDYALRPPREGGPIESNTATPQAAAQRVVLGTSTDTGTAAAPSNGTDMLLQQAGAAQTQPNIRSTLDKETTVISTKNKTVAEKLLFWDKNQPAVTPGENLDATTEAQRLNKEGIKSPTPGQYTPPEGITATTATAQ